MNGFRAYFHLHEEMAEVRAFTMSFGDDETGIELIDNEMGNGKWLNDKCYDLSGRRVNKPQKGMYIVNGRKVIVK